MKQLSRPNIFIYLVCAVALALTCFLFLYQQGLQQSLADAQTKNTRQEHEIKTLKSALEDYAGINKADLLTLCVSRASDVYSNYIRDNSVSSTEGNVTTFTPKSMNTLRIAEETLVSSKKSCTDKFGS